MISTKLGGTLFIFASIFTIFIYVMSSGFLMSYGFKDYLSAHNIILWITIPSILYFIEGIFLFRANKYSIPLLKILSAYWLLVFIFISHDSPLLIYSAVFFSFALYLDKKNTPANETVSDNQNNGSVTVGSRYHHYKNPNRFYTVTGLGIIEATGEPAVIYQAEYDLKNTWIRPTSVFLEEVEWQGKKVPRFTRVSQ